MACGTPVVAADTTALPETAGGAARLAPPEGAAFGAALEALLGDAAERTRLRDAGLARARRFSWDRTVERVDRVLDEALSARDGERCVERR
jgi:glycosyltransferase involved in cell wall biosynthesis